MAVQYRTKGFVLKRENIREADQLFSVFTEDFGKIKILGRAIRKIKSKLRPGIDIFYFSEIEFVQGKTYKTLTDAIALNKFKEIREDLKKTEIVQKIIETADDLIKGEEKDEKIYNLLKKFFAIDFKADSICPKSYYYYFWNLVDILGYQIDLYNCSKCHQKLIPNILNFSAENSGIVCLKCSDDSIKDKIKISPETVKILRVIQKGDWDFLKKLKIKDSHLKELEEASDNYFLYLKSLL